MVLQQAPPCFPETRDAQPNKRPDFAGFGHGLESAGANQGVLRSSAEMPDERRTLAAKQIARLRRLIGSEVER